LGLLLLIATPVARVIFSLIGFSIEKDLIYVAITTVVLINAIYIKCTFRPSRFPKP